MSPPGFVQYLLGPGSTWRDVGLACVDVAVVGYLVYRALLLIRGTRAINVLVGLLLLGIGYVGSQWANLVTLNWLLGHFLSYSFIFGVIVLFQADIRRGLAQLGRGTFLGRLVGDGDALQAGIVDAVARAAAELSRRREGALLVIERVGDLSEVSETGVRLDATPSPELFLSLFRAGAPLHDGAVVVQRGRVVAARCLLPLATTTTARDFGTRHRAALGLAEEVDAVTVVVSEERGEISLAVDGALHRRLDEAGLRQLLARLLAASAPSAGLWSRLGRGAVPPRGDHGGAGDGRAAL